MALDEGVSIAWDIGVRDVIFECDYQIIFNAVKGNSKPLAIVANIIWGIHKKIQDFKGVQFYQIKRQGNHSTHVLAQYAKGVFKYVTWTEKNPNMFEATLAHDKLNFSSS